MATTSSNNPTPNPNQLNEKELKRLIELLQKIDKLTGIAASNTANQAQQTGNARQQLNRLEKEWTEITGDISYAAVGFRRILEEIKDTNEGLNESIKIYNGFKSIADQIQYYQKGIMDMSERDVSKNLKLLETSKERLVTANELLEKKQITNEIDRKSIGNERQKLEISINALQQELKTGKNLKNNTDLSVQDKIKKREQLKEERIRIAEVNREYKSVENQIKTNAYMLEQNTAVLENYDALTEGLELSLKRINREVKFENIKNLDERFKNTVKETLSIDANLSRITKAFGSLTTLAQRALDHQSGISELSEKEVKNSLKELESKKKLFIESVKTFQEDEKRLKSEKIISESKQNSLKITKDNLEKLKASRKLDDEEEQRLKEIQDLYKKETQILEEVENKININAEVQKKLNETIKGQNKEYNEIRATLNQIAVDSINKIDEGFKNMVNDIATTDQISKSMSKSFQTLSDIAQKNQEYQENIVDVNKKDVEELIKKAELEKQSFTRNLNLLSIEKESLEDKKRKTNESIQDIEQQIKAEENSNKTTEEKKRIVDELSIKKAQLVENEETITSKLKANETLTAKTQEYISGQNEEYEKLNKSLKDTESRVNNINKSFGLNIGKNLKGALDKTGFGRLADMLGIDDATKKMAKLTANYTQNGKQALTFGQQFKVMGGGLMSMGSNLLKGFNPWLIAITGIIKAIQFFVDAMFEADKQVTNLAKSLVISKDAAREVRNRFSEIATNTSKYNDLLDNQLITANLKINEILGTSIDLSSQFGESGESIVRQFAIVSKFLKLSEEESQGLLKQFLISNKELKNTTISQDQIAKRILGTASLYKAQTGILINERKVLENVLKVSNAIRLSVKGGVDGLTKAAIEAQRLGLSLEKVSGIADGLLQFETSITAELEAELLLGKSFNLEKARLAALNNDFETLATEIQREIGTAEEFGDLNRVQQGAIAAIFSMSKDEFANMLVEQESLSKARGEFQKLGDDAFKQIQKTGALTDKQLQLLKVGKGTILEYYQALKAAGKSSEDLSSALGDLAYQSLSSQDAQEKFNEVLEKAKEIFTRFVDGGSLDKLADFITRFVTSVEAKGLTGVLTGGLMSESEVKEFQTQQQAESLDKQIAEKKAQGEDISQLEEQRKGVSADQTKQQYLKSLEYQYSPSDIDQMIFGKSNLQQKAAGETYLLEDVMRIVSNLLGGIGDVEKNQQLRQKAAQQQLEKAEKEYMVPTQSSDSRLATEPIKGQDLVVQMQDGIIKKNKGLKENGGLVIAKFNQGELQPIAQGIKQDQAFALSTSEAMSTSSFTKTNITEIISTAIAKLTENELLLSKILNGSLTTEPAKPKDLLEATLQGGTQGGVGGALFSAINYLMEPSIKPTTTPIESSNLNTTNNNNPVLINNTSNINSNDEVVKTLREAINVLKAIQTKDTSVQLSLDGEVVARKLSPYTPQYLVRDYSTLS